MGSVHRAGRGRAGRGGRTRAPLDRTAVTQLPSSPADYCLLRMWAQICPFLKKVYTSDLYSRIFKCWQLLVFSEIPIYTKHNMSVCDLRASASLPLSCSLFSMPVCQYVHTRPGQETSPRGHLPGLPSAALRPRTSAGLLRGGENGEGEGDRREG